ncbi:hypothetical protein N7519_011699 [Penicillium mononematosum]|uniref:uncharacterized protein n=1 Tax=Penicillium mononematosum TaxID=268346 RepID=UPI00254731D7|nr:uncharacterized protein N7519_011699 [Penicillium mononematosum]KAJ6181238.1 hypothetical protein N7519_011699 [Penicillium mononematosum]
MAAADETITETRNIERSIGRSCGSVFASTLAQSLSSAASQLLDPRERSQPSHSLLPNNTQGPLFFRPKCYLVAALVEANKPKDEAMAIIDAIEQFMERQRKFYEPRAC